MKLLSITGMATVAVLAVALLFPASLPARTQTGSTYNITVIRSGSGVIYRDTVAGFRDSLPLPDVAYTGIDLEADGRQALDEDIVRATDLFVAVGTRAALYLEEHATGKEVLNLLIPEESFASIWDEKDPAWAVVIDQPPDRQVAMVRDILGTGITLGILTGPDKKSTVAAFTQQAQRNGIDVYHETISSVDEASRAIERLLARCDAIYMLPDRVAITPYTAKWLIYLAYQKRIPVFGYSRQLVRAGAVAGIFSDPVDIGSTGAAVAQAILSGHLPQRIRYSNTSIIESNDTVARSLGISITETRREQ